MAPIPAPVNAPLDDIEKQNAPGNTAVDDDSTRHSSADGAAEYGEAQIGVIQRRNPILRFLVNLESRIDKFAKFEAMGVERVPEDKRRPPQILNVR